MARDNSSNDAPVVVASGLTMDFWDDTKWVNVVNDVSFSISAGETLGLAGESGCGKSTTAGALLGYLRSGTRLRTGQVEFLGQDILGLRERELNQIRGAAISMVPQTPSMALTPTMRVGRQAIEVLRAHGKYRGNEAERVLELFEDVCLPNPPEMLRRYPHQLSGGQQQRVAIAIALSCEPGLVLLDEPTTDLDVTTQAQILRLLLELKAEHGMAMLYVTHNLGVLAQIADRVAIMYAGEIVEMASTEEIYLNPLHPYTKGLIAAVPQIDADERSSTRMRGMLRREEMPAGCRFAPRCIFATTSCFDDPQALVEVRPKHFVACCRCLDTTQC